VALTEDAWVRFYLLMPINDLVRKLRLALGDSQQEFAQRLNSAIRTIARWESGQSPNHKAISQLERIARERGLIDLADGFRAVLSKRIGREFSAETEFDPTMNVPTTREEHRLVDAFLQVLRQPGHGALASSFRESLEPVAVAREDFLEGIETHARHEAAVHLLLDRGEAPEKIASELKVDLEWVKWLRERAKDPAWVKWVKSSRATPAQEPEKK
jgi:transcriptional regulator with XRE-family HTH domain